jgi:site-specific recombinase XerD
MSTSLRSIELPENASGGSADMLPVTGIPRWSDGPAGAPAAPVLAVVEASSSEPTWERVVDAYLSADVDSDATRRAYRRHLQHCLGGLLGVDGLVSDLTGEQLAGYRGAVSSGRLAPASQAQRLAAIRSFLRWSGTMGAHQLNGDIIRTALRTPRATVRRPYAVLTEPEILRVLAAADTTRDRALLAVLVGAGLRAAEVCALDVGDLVEDHEGGAALHVRQGKGRKDRIVPVQPDVATLIRSYLADTGRRLGQSGPLFRAHDRGSERRIGATRLATRSVGYLVERLCARAGVEAKHISPHSLRHTMAIRALRGGASIVALSKVLGHSQITTTQRYTDHLETAELRAAMPLLPTAGRRRR